MTRSGAPDDLRAIAKTHADVIASGDTQIDFAAAFGELATRGHRLALLEGGPSINNVLFGLGLVDELNLSVAPAVVGGDPLRILKGAPLDGGRPLLLDQVIEHDSYLFLRYLSA